MRIRVRGMWTAGMSSLSGPTVITIDGDRIVKLANDDDSVDFDLDGVVIPGLVDCHDHIGLNVGDEHAQSIDDAPRMAIRGVAALQKMLDAGITTIRNCGDRADVEPYWIEALESGTINGPRVVRAVTPICRTGGHAWYLSAQADGAEALRAAVRRNVRDGADFIKVMATGGMGTAGSNEVAAEFAPGELQALVDEARRLGKRVAAHAHGGEGVDQALDAEVNSIEHGVLLTKSQLKRMAAQGTYLVVTMGISRAFAFDPVVPASSREKATRTLDGYRELIRSAREAGVLVVVGSDCVHGGVAAEAGYLVDEGFSEVEALTAATSNGADLVGLSDIGRLESGKLADLIVLSGDPVSDISALNDVRGVMQGGRWTVEPIYSR